MIGIPYAFIMLALSQTTTKVEAEEIVTMCASPNNGAGPFHSMPVTIPLQEPFRMFFTATERGGSAPSDIIDIFGPGHDQTLRYARIKLE